MTSARKLFNERAENWEVTKQQRTDSSNCIITWSCNLFRQLDLPVETKIGIKLEKILLSLLSLMTPSGCYECRRIVATDWRDYHCMQARDLRSSLTRTWMTRTNETFIVVKMTTMVRTVGPLTSGMARVFYSTNRIPLWPILL